MIFKEIHKLKHRSLLYMYSQDILDVLDTILYSKV